MIIQPNATFLGIYGPTTVKGVITLEFCNPKVK